MCRCRRRDRRVAAYADSRGRCSAEAYRPLLSETRSDNRHWCPPLAGPDLALSNSPSAQEVGEMSPAHYLGGRHLHHPTPRGRVAVAVIAALLLTILSSEIPRTR